MPVGTDVAHELIRPCKSQVELTDKGEFDYEAIELALTPETRLIHIQRSCGFVLNLHPSP